MKKNKLSLALCASFAFFASEQINAQVSGENAFMIGQYVEIGISQFGYEGAPLDDAIPTHYRGLTDILGFVANPAEDDWIEYNGDFYQPGAPESGNGMGYTTSGGTVVNLGNNAMGLNEIPGEITSFFESADSVIVTWEGMPSADSLLLKIVYELQKDQHYYTTSISIDNIGSETYTDVYYYRTIDVDCNRDIGWPFATDNIIESQSGMADDSVIVRSSSTVDWTSELVLNAYGSQWKGFIGGFSNRIPSDMWNGTGGLNVTEGYSVFTDQAIGISYKIESLPPGRRAGSEVFSFASAFKSGISFEVVETDGLNENGSIDFNLYPNPVEGNSVSLEVNGLFNYTIVDIKGATVLNGQGDSLVQIDLSTIEKGIYFITIKQDNNQITEKLIVK